MAAALNPRPRRVSEPILVPVKLHGYFPKAFVWRGQRHDVRAVEACRQLPVSTGGESCSTGGES